MEAFITGLTASIGDIVTDVALVAVAALALFGLFFGIRAGMKALKTVGK